MRKSRINLLNNKVDYQRFENVFSWIRILALGLSVLTVIATVILGFVILSQNIKINGLLDQKRNLLTSLKDRQDEEVKLFYIQNKYQQLQTYLKDDAHSLPYYNLLNTALLKSTESASLKSFNIEKSRETDFIVSFINFNELLNFFRFVESEEFLKYFEWVSLKNFSAIEDNSKKQSYELSFKAKFIKINETEN